MGSDKTQKERIQEFWRENPNSTSTQVAEAIDTSPAYARRCKPDDVSTGVGGGASLAARAHDRAAKRTEGAELHDTIEETVDEQDKSDEHPLSRMLIEDTHDEYTCGECDAPVDYLDDSCSSCGESLVWLKGVGE